MVHTHDSLKAEHAAHAIKQSTNVLAHEHEAIGSTNVLGEQNIDSLFMLLGRVEILNGKLHRQLVEWHTKFPERPSLRDSDQFWADLKELRATKEQLQFLLDAIEQHEERTNTFKTQLKRTRDSVDEIEKYFDGYLDRVNHG